MIEKDKTYTYDELEKIFTEASAKTITRHEEDGEKSGMSTGVVATTSMLLMLSLARLHTILFKKENKEEK